MRKKLSYIPGIVMVLTLMLSSTCFAQVADFRNKFVDSNSYTYITSAVKDSGYTADSIYISEIYKADGSWSNYKYIWAKTSDQGSGKLVKKEEWVDITVANSSSKAGDVEMLYAKGANPSLDCRIYGYWDVH